MATEPARLTDRLEKTLASELAAAQQRRTKTSEAIGGGPLPDKPKLGFAPTAVRIGKRAIARKELQDAKANMELAVEDLMGKVNIADQAQRADKKIELIKRGGDLQNQILQSTLALDKELTLSKLKSQERAAIFKAMGGLATSLGFAFATGRGGQPEFGGGGGTPLLQEGPVSGQLVTDSRPQGVFIA